MTNTEESDTEEETKFDLKKPQTGSKQQRRRKTKKRKNSSTVES